MTEPVEKTKRPASQYYWGDWWKDKGLHSCSLTARGLWHEMNCLMHEGEPYGHLTLNGRPMTIAQLANQCRITPPQCTKLVRELEDAGVFSRSQEGAVFSRRMVRDEAIRNARAAGGKAGAEHGIKGAEAGSKGGRPKQIKGASETPLPGFEKPPPSSSSSSASSPPTEVEEPAIAGLPPAEPPTLTLLGDEVDPPGIPPCPHRRIIALFAQKVPELPKPRVELWEGSQGAENLRARWKWLMTAKREDGARYASTVEEGLEWFGNFFDRVATSDFLTGRNGKWSDCSLQWLMQRQKFNNVIDNHYQGNDRRVA